MCRVEYRFLESSKTHSTWSTTASSALCLRLGLQLLGDLHLDVEELGGAAVDADTLALVEVTLTVVGWDALLHAGAGEP